jgi:hypothetical protein
VNAAEQANSLSIASKIAAIVNLFKSAFPDLRADLKPWQNDPATRDMVDPDSIDIGFHLPGMSRSFQSRSMLLQIRFHDDTLTTERRAIGAEIAGFDHNGKRWCLSTVQDWIFEGDRIPKPEVAEKLKDCLRQAIDLFNSSMPH